jgi:hypothetical protein
MDVTLRIKNLSIALEALSRISGYAASSLYSEIAEALMAELKKYKKENEEAKPTVRPTKPSTDDISF